jgi:hypothetical protein
MDLEPLPAGPCEPTALHRVGRVAGLALVAAALVLSVVVSPYVFVGFLAACAVFGLLRAGWRWLRDLR